MAEYIHLIDTENEFLTEYRGEGYKKPWLSFTKEVRKTDYNKKYIKFEDPEVERICIENFSMDGSGVTLMDAAEVNNFGYVFSGNTAITSFNEMEYFGVTKIDAGQFKGCSNLTEVTFPANMEGALHESFAHCTSLSHITFKSVPRNYVNGYDSFLGSQNITRIDVPTLEDWINIFRSTDVRYNQTMLSNNSGADVYIGGQLVTAITWPLNETVVPGGVLSNIRSLRSVTLHSGITYIGSYALRGCSNLQELNMPAQGFPVLSSIGSNAFGSISAPFDLDAPALTSIGIGVFANSHIRKVSNLGSISSITQALFGRCEHLEEITIPSTVETIEYDGFYFTFSLTTFVSLATVPPVANPYGLGLEQADVYVPYSADHSILNAYKTADVWDQYASRIYELNPDGTVPSN